MSSVMTGILRSINRGPGEPLNVLTAPTHEAVETSLCKTGHQFYALSHPSFKTWNEQFRPRPDNYNLLVGNSIQEQLSHGVPFDCVLSQNKFGQYQILAQVAAGLNIPLITYEHTLPVPEWPAQQREACRRMKGDLNVFIAEFSVEQWGWSLDDPAVRVVDHGIDTDRFRDWVGGDGKILTVVNQYPQRDWCCGFKLYEQVTHGLPKNPIGASPGFSEAAKNEDELIRFYQNAAVFLNTSLISPLPHSLLEAMSVGCPVVSTATCMIPEVIVDGINGYISNDPAVLRSRLSELLADQEKARRMGENARQTVLDRFAERQFVHNWKNIFNEAASVQPLGWL